MKKFGQVIQLKPEHYDEYVKAHAEVWSEVLAQIEASHIQNYSIFHHNGLLFAYFEYVGEDFESDMAEMAADPTTQKWWAWMKPMQQPLPEAGEDWWLTMEQVFEQK
ncbi:putative Rhamnose mutarotase [Vibrio nigripulchritudo SFn27]|uniref:Putative Rhamnose mutarotase n=1 Tax=Vibrio nigripulchritudo TaxID=28173 RepID=U4KAP8_9VIBR|nr:L-rhamnose mutarotase [Vibrio nigripulchritudo]CCN83584.1 putative Rhamnose mutarotase [Vibrio nigripulchritudo BLFn1]CCN87411.1 putative Rhamnose mutarotase [Vibrio nigripulchritudo SFn27]CCN94790.1 putative Rhamnose mutarotase [Vibrio nigripulchritudo ENn2]CCO40670.1 putative Rhamnose mutarotase [Vibrio nigripulchritudo SFn135]CCO54747.1 putative Rhamnose mutarotase [Vibrio nigripulchritudo Wn13]